MIASTLELDEAARRHWEIVVVGAGPAGSMAARELARLGRQVLLVDKAIFPRMKVCGCCLNGSALATLNAVGLGRLPEQAGAVRLNELRLAMGNRDVLLTLTGGVALSREAFDAALVTAAVQAGASFLSGTSVGWIEPARPTNAVGPACRAGLGKLAPLGKRGLLAVAQADSLCHRPDEKRLTLRTQDRELQVGTALVLAANGLGGRLFMDGTNYIAPAVPASRIGAGVIADCVPAFYGEGTIFMACGTGGYVGLVRLKDGRLDIAAALDTEHVRAMGGPGKASVQILHATGWPPIADLADLPWRGTPALTRRARQVAAERVFVLGDAAGYVEPFTGEGIAWALAAGAAVAPLAARAAVGWQPAFASEWARLYRHTISRRQWTCRFVTRILRHSLLTRMMIEILDRLPSLATPFIRRLNMAPGEW